MIEFKRWGSMTEVVDAHKATGGHWFDKDTLSFFNSRLGDLIDGRWFISSERRGPGSKRRYTIRVVMPDADITTVGEFQNYSTSNRAMADLGLVAKAFSVGDLWLTDDFRAIDRISGDEVAWDRVHLHAANL